ncbi:quinolinate synthase NadA [bacterium]|nr:quinolinate synthase NadA [bacterium]
MQNILAEIERLKRERKAIILAHNYQPPEVQDIADFAADSLELARYSMDIDAKVIVLCGVRFMAEMAHILNPEKIVLLPDEGAGCPLADSITPEDVRRLREEYPDAIFLAYVNTSAAVKAECDICYTSANILEVIRKLPADRRLVVLPDRHLASWARRKTGRDIIIWQGECPVHQAIKEEDVLRVKKEHPDSALMVHPECKEEVIRWAELVGGTGKMLRFAKESNYQSYIVGTERDMCHRLKREVSEKIFLPANEEAVCQDMKKISLEKVLRSLQTLSYKIELDESIRERARKTIERMFSL